MLGKLGVTRRVKVAVGHRLGLFQLS